VVFLFSFWGSGALKQYDFKEKTIIHLLEKAVTIHLVITMGVRATNGDFNAKT